MCKHILTYTEQDGRWNGCQQLLNRKAAVGTSFMNIITMGSTLMITYINIKEINQFGNLFFKIYITNRKLMPRQKLFTTPMRKVSTEINEAVMVNSLEKPATPHGISDTNDKNIKITYKDIFGENAKLPKGIERC